MAMNTVGVVGAGTIGVGVAQSLAQTRHRVVLLDVDEGALQRARHTIKLNTRFQNFFGKKSAEPAVNALDQITFTTNYDDFKRVEFVIENAPEIRPLKEQIYRRLDQICSPSTIFAANTSAISITHLASVTNRPTKVIGIHFMNPVPQKTTVELIPGYHTSAETIETAQAVLAQMGKSSVLVKDSPGFVSNRVLMLTINEAIFLVHDQVSSAEDIDKLFRECFGHKMGPLETADLIGLDTILLSIEVLYESFADSKYRPCPLLKTMVSAGLLGRKSGRGFYTYPDLAKEMDANG